GGGGEPQEGRHLVGRGIRRLLRHPGTRAVRRAGAQCGRGARRRRVLPRPVRRLPRL
ncbi:MAG: hypothetical protein AVDCRST_MAG52-2102, partial [uncultured Blastococcus sp.]